MWQPARRVGQLGDYRRIAADQIRQKLIVVTHRYSMTTLRPSVMNAPTMGA
jgi:hypothetical protein